eukprot:scaffold127_cov230-Pinguiococcus_pyrenoidosus.AAC.3
MAQPELPEQTLLRIASLSPARLPLTNSRASGKAARLSCVISVPGTNSRSPANSTSEALYSSRTENVTSSRVSGDTALFAAVKIVSSLALTQLSKPTRGIGASGVRKLSLASMVAGLRYNTSTAGSGSSSAIAIYGSESM